jgi:hypothetical protein
VAGAQLLKPALALPLPAPSLLCPTPASADIQVAVIVELHMLVYGRDRFAQQARARQLQHLPAMHRRHTKLPACMFLFCSAASLSRACTALARALVQPETHCTHPCLLQWPDLVALLDRVLALPRVAAYRQGPQCPPVVAPMLA